MKKLCSAFFYNAPSAKSVEKCRSTFNPLMFIRYAVKRHVVRSAGSPHNNMPFFT